MPIIVFIGLILAAILFIAFLTDMFMSGGGRRVTRASVRLAAIRDLDLSLVRSKVAQRNHWTAERAADAEVEYRRFLGLLATHPGETISPWNNDLDLFWHEHILDTQRYALDCQRIFGKIIHHDPHITSDTKRHQKVVRRTEELRGSGKSTSESNGSSCGTTCGTAGASVGCSTCTTHSHDGGSGHGGGHDGGSGHGCAGHSGGHDGGSGHSCGGHSCGGHGCGGHGCGGGGCGGH